jgi:hypothetical protein
LFKYVSRQIFEPIEKRIIGNVIDGIRRLWAHFDDHMFGVGLAAKPVVYCGFNGFEHSITRDLIKGAVG